MSKKLISNTHSRVHKLIRKST